MIIASDLGTHAFREQLFINGHEIKVTFILLSKALGSLRDIKDKFPRQMFLKNISDF